MEAALYRRAPVWASRGVDEPWLEKSPPATPMITAPFTASGGRDGVGFLQVANPTFQTTPVRRSRPRGVERAHVETIAE
jgi:hypothetical protein